MGKWYNKAAVKGAMVVVAVASTVVLVINTLLCLMFISGGGRNLTENQSFEDSAMLEDMMFAASQSVMQELEFRQIWGEKGEYDPQQPIDVVSYMNETKSEEEESSELIFPIGELAEWGKNLNKGMETGKVVVCKKDGKNPQYVYYKFEEFRELVNKGELSPGWDTYTEQFLEELSYGYYDEMKYENAYDGSLYESNSSGEQLFLKNAEGEVVYVDCWTLERNILYGGPFDFLLEQANTSEKWNGNLAEAYDYLRNAALDIFYKVKAYTQEDSWWQPGDTNYRFAYVGEDSKKLFTNETLITDKQAIATYLASVKEAGNYKYIVVKPTFSDFQTNMDVSASKWRSLVEDQMGNDAEDYIFVASVDTDFPIQDAFQEGEQSYNATLPYQKWIIPLMIISAIFLCISLIFLTVAAGRNGKDEELHLNFFDRWKTEIAAAVCIALVTGFTVVLFGTGWIGMVNIRREGFSFGSEYYGHYTGVWIMDIIWSDIVVMAIYIAASMGVCLAGYLSLVRRIKAKTLWKNSILARFVGEVKMFWEKRTMVWRTALTLAAFFGIHWFIILNIGYYGGEIFLFMLFVLEVIASYRILKETIMKEQLIKGLREIASGNIGYQIPTDKMKGKVREMAEQVNKVGNGMKLAVDEGIKSERLKTDLITNVSHDIKTPLTSIINYVDLLKRENLDDPKIKGYLEILEAKAQRLKTLTEDVVEASKVSSGNITLEYMNVNLVEMVNQTIGEFTEKFSGKNLTIVATLPKETALIRVDGRRMWRVLENIFNNAAKYAMPGTRVYADLRSEKGEVVFSLKNISEQPLNISADELTERFIRGDISRSTEGSGLGLSIAKDLTEMQGGTMKLYLDGDLFKVTITFPESKTTGKDLL